MHFTATFRVQGKRTFVTKSKSVYAADAASARELAEQMLADFPDGSTIHDISRTGYDRRPCSSRVFNRYARGAAYRRGRIHQD